MGKKTIKTDNRSGSKATAARKQLKGHKKYESEALGIAHDLNNILATISGYAEMLHEDLPAGSPLKEQTVKILTAVTRAKSITDQMLFEGGQGKQPVNINDILIETIGFVSAVLTGNVNIIQEIPELKIFVSANPEQLFRVFLNLMTNAVQSMDKKGGTLFTGVKIVRGIHAKPLISRDVLSDDYVVITFRDTGKGMDDQVMKKIFEPFFTTREPGKGNGIGLSVVRSIVEDLEGKILVSSKLNEGSQFEVYLPVVK